MRLEVIVVRDPDAGNELFYFLDGEPIGTVDSDIVVNEYHVDPGAGHTRTEWDDDTASEVEQASHKAGAFLKQLRDDYADNEYIIDNY